MVSPFLSLKDIALVLPKRNLDDIKIKHKAVTVNFFMKKNTIGLIGNIGTIKNDIRAKYFLILFKKYNLHPDSFLYKPLVSHQMKFLSLAIFLSFASLVSFGQASTLNIIPEPVKATVRPGMFVLPKHVIIEGRFTPEMMPAVDYLRSKLSTSTGALVTLTSKAAVPPTIRLVVKPGYRRSDW